MEKITMGYIAYIISILISAFRPIFFKKLSNYTAITIYISLITMFIGSIIYIIIDLYKKKELNGNTIKEKILKSFEIKNFLLSITSEIRFITKIYGIILLPITISIPLSQIWIIFAIIFDKIINKTELNMWKYISIGIITIGSIVINFDQILLSKKSNKMNIHIYNYIVGITLILLSSILRGYLLTEFQNIAIKTNPGETLMIESVGALIVMTPIIIIGIILNKIKIPNWKLIIMLLLSLTFLFDIGILLKFYGLKYIKEYHIIVLSSLSVIISVIFGFILLSESITLYKLMGILLISSGFIISYKNEFTNFYDKYIKIYIKNNL